MSDKKEIEIGEKTGIHTNIGVMCAIIAFVAVGVWRVAQWERKLDDIHRECWRVQYQEEWADKLREQNKGLNVPTPSSVIMEETSIPASRMAARPQAQIVP